MKLLSVLLLLVLMSLSPTRAEESSSSVQLQSVCPYLPSQDVERAAKFYTEVLGFQIRHQEGSSFILLGREEVEIALILKEPEDFKAMSCMIKLHGVETIHAACQAAKAEITSPLALKPWGMRMFIVKDLDGNLLDFGENVK